MPPNNLPMLSSKYAVAALSLIVLQAFIVIVFESVVVHFHLEFIGNCVLNTTGEGISESDLIYHGLFMAAQIFQILLCLDALYQRNSAQLYALVLYDLLVVVYGAIQLQQHVILEEVGCPDDSFDTSKASIWPGGLPQARVYYEHMMRPFEYLIITVIPLSFLILAYISYYLSKNFTWENYRSYSADIQVRNAAVAFAVFLTFLKLDVYFILSFAAQLIPSQLLDYSGSLAETVLLFILGVALMCVGFYSVYRENKYTIVVFIVGAVLGVAYFLWKLVLVSLPQPNVDADPYQFTRRFLTFTIVITLILLVASILNAIVCFKNMLSGINVFQAANGNKTLYGQMPTAVRGNNDPSMFNQYPIELDGEEGKPGDGNQAAPADIGMWTIE